MRNDVAYVVAIMFAVVIPSVWGYHHGSVSYEAGALGLLGSIAISVAALAGQEVCSDG